MMNTNISAPVRDGGTDARAEKEQEQVSPPIREVWDALTHPLFLLEPLAARAYDNFMCRLRAVIENGEDGIVWAMSVLETANRVMDNTALKQAVLARYQQQRSYIKRNAENIAAFAKARYALLGRGIVIIDWPSSGFPLSENIQDGIEYMTEEAWRLGEALRHGENPQAREGGEAGEQTLQALGQYDPARQAVVIFDDIENSAADAYVPTFIFESLDNDSYHLPPANGSAADRINH